MNSNNNIYINHYHNKSHSLLYNNVPDNSKYFKWSSHMRVDVQKDDTLDFKLFNTGVKYEDIFESFNSSSIDIYYIEYLQVPSYT